MLRLSRISLLLAFACFASIATADFNAFVNSLRQEKRDAENGQDQPEAVFGNPMAIWDRLNRQCNTSDQCNKGFNGQKIFVCQGFDCVLTQEGEDFLENYPPNVKRYFQNGQGRKRSYRKESFHKKRGIETKQDGAEVSRRMTRRRYI